MSKYNFNRPRPIPLVMTLVAVLLFFSLGFWQLQRLAWKEGLIAQLNEAMAAPPTELLSIPEAELVKKEFYRVTFSGRAMPMTPVYMAARYRNNNVGYHVLLPVQVFDKAIRANKQNYKMVLVNMGWIPSDMRGKMHFETSWTRYTGMIRIAGRKNLFTPDNQPAKNLWFWYDLPAMAQFTHHELLPVSIDRLDERDASTNPTPPNGFTTASIKLRNDHLQYAIIWFAIGLACFVIFVVYHTKKKPS